MKEGMDKGQYYWQTFLMYFVGVLGCAFLYWLMDGQGEGFEYLAYAITCFIGVYVMKEIRDRGGD